MRVTYAYDLALPSQFAAPIQFLHTCRALCDLGVDVRVVTGPLRTPLADCLAYYDLTPHERFEIVPVAWSSSARRRGRELSAVLVAPQSDRHVVISRGEPGLTLFRDLRTLRVRAGRLHVYEAHRPATARSPSVWRERPSAALRTRLLRRRERQVLCWVDGVVCLTEGVRDALPERCSEGRPVLVLPSGTSVPPERPPGDGQRDLDVVYAGKIGPRKDVRLLLDAMRRLPDHRLSVVGGTPREVTDLAKLAGSLDLGSRVTLHGLLPPREVQARLRRARVAVCPLPPDNPVAARFTSPLKLLEAMANGAAVVASDLATTRALVEDGRSALLAPPGDAEAFAGRIRVLLENRQLARSLAREAFSDVRAYAWERRAERLHGFLDGLPAREC